MTILKTLSHNAMEMLVSKWMFKKIGCRLAPVLLMILHIAPKRICLLPSNLKKWKNEVKFSSKLKNHCLFEIWNRTKHAAAANWKYYQTRVDELSPSLLASELQSFPDHPRLPSWKDVSGDPLPDT